MRRFFSWSLSIAITLAIFIVMAEFILPPIAKRISQGLYHTTYVEYCLKEEEFFTDQLRSMVVSRAEELGVTADNFDNIADRLGDEMAKEDSIDRLANQAVQIDCFLNAVRKRIENTIHHSDAIYWWLYVYTDD